MPITKMPMTGDKTNHREKIPEHAFPLPALVARPVSKKEVKKKLARGDRGPQDSLDTEWSSLRDDDCRDEENVIEFDDLIFIRFNVCTVVEIWCRQFVFLYE